MSTTNRNKLHELILSALILQSVVSRVNAAAHVNGRTQAQRDALCTNYRKVKALWDKKDTKTKFAINIIEPTRIAGQMRYRGCRQHRTDRKNFFNYVSCRKAPNQWQWRSDGKLQSTVLGNGGCFVYNEQTRACWDSYIPTNEKVTSIVEPAVCPCGQDFVISSGSGYIQSYCDDIDECREQHTCPSNSVCVNTAGGYECRCSPGFENSFSGGPDVPKDGRCVSAPRQTSDRLGVDSFRMRVTNVTPGEVRMTLHQLADGAAEFAVPVQRHSDMYHKFTSIRQTNYFNFDGLSPGSRYVLYIADVDNSDPNNPRVGRDYLSEIVTTKCYCSIIDGDDTGKPDNTVVTQKEGYVLFEFADNSRCEDAYSFSRGLPGTAGTTVGQQVFTSDYYYFSQQQCAREPYSPGRQAADDLRVSGLVVGQQYAYQIRAAAKQPWRNSNPTTILHTVEWQASIDGQVTLEKMAGLLPVENVMVEYRLEDLEGGRISVCDNVVEGWCQTATSASGKFKIDVSTVHPLLNNDDEFPLRMRFGKWTGSVSHRFLCDDAVKDCSHEIDQSNQQQATTPAPTRGSAYVTGRTKQQRDSLCANYRRVKALWDKKDTNTIFAINLVMANRVAGNMRNRGCRKFRTDRKNFFNYVSCREAPKQWKWRSDGKLESTVLGNRGCFVYNEQTRACWDSYIPTNDAVTRIVEPAVCPCGQDWFEQNQSGTITSYCADIDECQEEHQCPNDSTCVNTVGDYGCRCMDGFVNPDSGGHDVSKTGRCVLADDVKIHTAVNYLRHLEFGVPMHVIDDTTVPFRGKVTVADTEMPGEGALGCPIPNAEVCLVDHTSRNTLQVTDPVCVRTDSKGNYALPAVIGTTVSPQINYHDHIFQAVNPRHEEQFKEGILIKPDGVYEGFHMHDVTKALLTVEVAGGLCDRVLGRSEVRVKMQGCDWEGQVLEQSGFRQIHEVISQPVDIQVESVKGITDGLERHVITSALSPSQDTSIDLRDLENEDAVEDESVPDGVNVDDNSISGSAGVSENSNEAKALEEEEAREEERTNLKRVRFQYDGTDVLAVRFGDMDTGTCGSNAAEDGVASYSLHVLPSFTFFGLNVFARQDFGYDDIGTCTKYPPNSTVTIQNQVGVSDSPGDRNWIAKLEADPDLADEVRALRACSPSCVHPLEMDAETGENARISIVLFTGQPNPFDDLAKTVFVTMDKTGIRHKSDVVVTGDYELSGGFSVALPTHKPLLVLRDPPGGNSYAYYENVLSTIRVEMEHYETYVGIDAGAKASFGAATEVSSCAGFGVEVCLEVVETEAYASVDIGGGTNFEVSLIDRSDEATFTTTWSYQTSGDPWVAGTLSDTFLVPNLNVKFKKVDEVMWEKPMCARTEEKLKFALESPENKPAIGFLSRYDIDSVEIPEIKRLRDAAQANVTANNCPNSMDAVDDSTSEECVEFIVNRDVMAEAVGDWESFLVRHDEITANATKGLLEGLKPHSWFDSVRGDASKKEKDKLPNSHWSGLVPKSLADDATRIRTIGSSEDDEGDESEELERINLIKFDGGGSEMRFELKRHRLDEHTKKLGPPHENMQQQAHLGGWGKFNLKSGAAVDMEVAGNVHENGDYHHTRADKDGKETTIGFVLSDPDTGDVFDVEIFMDPDFGTFIFHTVGGRSRCPVEDGTVPREQPHIEVVSGPSVPLAPDSLMVFEVELTNQGISPSAFELFTDHRVNGGLLTQMANGDTLTRPQQYDRIDPGETVTTTVTIGRGPLLFDNPGLPLFFRSACEGIDNIGDGNLIARGDKVASASVTLFNVNDPSKPAGEKERIRYAEPCPKIEWAGDLAINRSFRINKADKKATGTPQYSLKIVVRNPETAYRSFAEVVADPLGRLEDAGLWFRKVGSAEWSRALYRPAGEDASKPINFTTLREDDFGYITVEWDVEALGDGEYEIEARTICPDDTGALPDSFNFAAAPRLQGFLDRNPPQLFGTPRPGSDEELLPGRSVHFEFTELVECTRPHVFTLEVEVDAFPNRTFSNIADNLHVVCEGRSIWFEFDSSHVDENEMRGSVIDAALSGVRDLHGNAMDPFHPIVHRVRVAGQDAKEPSANTGTRGRYLMREEFASSKDSFVVDDLKEMLEAQQEEISALLAVSKSLETEQKNERSTVVAVGALLFLLLVVGLLMSLVKRGRTCRQEADGDMKMAMII